MLPGPEAWVTKIWMPAKILFTTPRRDLILMLTLGSFHSNT